jgi:hypothetical protein
MSTVEETALATVRQLADSCAGVLQTALVSAILHGSLTNHDFRPGTSDLDLLLVVESGLSSGQADGLVDAVRAADLGQAGGIDLLIVTRQAAEQPGDHPARELTVGRWPGSGEELEVEGPDDQVPDVWPELSEARANGRSLLGPAPRDVIGEVPADRVRANGTGWLETWLTRTDDDKNAVLMVLTACRIWGFGLTGEHLSKTEAGRWALERDPSLVGVELALAARTTPSDPRIAAREVESVLLRALSDLERLPPRG